MFDFDNTAKAVNKCIDQMHSSALMVGELTDNFTLTFDDMKGDLSLLMYVNRWVAQYNEAAGLLNTLGCRESRNIINRFAPEMCVYSLAFIDALNALWKDDTRIDYVVKSVQEREDSFDPRSGYAEAA